MPAHDAKSAESRVPWFPRTLVPVTRGQVEAPVEPSGGEAGGPVRRAVPHTPGSQSDCRPHCRLRESHCRCSVEVSSGSPSISPDLRVVLPHPFRDGPIGRASVEPAFTTRKELSDLKPEPAGGTEDHVGHPSTSKDLVTLANTLTRARGSASVLELKDWGLTGYSEGCSFF